MTASTSYREALSALLHVGLWKRPLRYRSQPEMDLDKGFSAQPRVHSRPLSLAVQYVTAGYFEAGLYTDALLYPPKAVFVLLSSLATLNRFRSPRSAIRDTATDYPQESD
jgi:hypothetical protein